MGKTVLVVLACLCVGGCGDVNDAPEIDNQQPVSQPFQPSSQGPGGASVDDNIIFIVNPILPTRCSDEEFLESRCNLDTLELCGAGREWITIHSCTDFHFECSDLPEDCGRENACCVPVEE